MPKVSTLQEYDVDISPRTRTTLVVAQEYARDAGAWVHSYEGVKLLLTGSLKQLWNELQAAQRPRDPGLTKFWVVGLEPPLL